MSTHGKAAIRLDAPWQLCVLVCRKCPRRGGGKKRDRKRFISSIRDRLRERFGKKRARVIEVGCLDLCPKGRITVAVTGKAAPLRVLLVEPDQTEAVLAACDEENERP